MPARRPLVAVLASGGLDSCALIEQLNFSGHQVLPIYIRSGLVWESAERYWLNRFLHRLVGVCRRADRRFQRALPGAPRIAAPLPLVELSMPVADLYGRHWALGQGRVPSARSSDTAVYLPGRNLLLTTKAALYCAQQQIPRLAIGVLRGNPFADSSTRFFRQVSAVVRTAVGRPVVVERPLAQQSKVQVIRRARGFLLGLSFSCINPSGRQHCGRCNKCAERRRAFRKAGQPDPTRYASG